MLSLMRFILWVGLIYLYFRGAEWVWKTYMPDLTGSGILLISVVTMFFCVVFAQITVWKLSEMFVREKYYE